MKSGKCFTNYIHSRNFLKIISINDVKIKSQFKNHFDLIVWYEVKGGVTTKSYAYFGVIHGWWRTWFLGGVCYEKLKSATIALIFPCHQHNAREMWAKYSLQPRPWTITDLDLKINLQNL